MWESDKIAKIIFEGTICILKTDGNILIASNTSRAHRLGLIDAEKMSGREIDKGR